MNMDCIEAIIHGYIWYISPCTYLLSTHCQQHMLLYKKRISYLYVVNESLTFSC